MIRNRKKNDNPPNNHKNRIHGTDTMMMMIRTSHLNPLTTISWLLLLLLSFSYPSSYIRRRCRFGLFDVVSSFVISNTNIPHHPSSFTTMITKRTTRIQKDRTVRLTHNLREKMQTYSTEHESSTKSAFRLELGALVVTE